MSELFDTVICGNFITMSTTTPFVSAVGIKDGIIVETGNVEDLKAKVQETTEVMDLRNRTIIPGFIDTHCHSVLSGVIADSVDLRDADSIREVLKRIGKGAAEIKPGSFLLATGFDYAMIEEGRMVTLDELNEAAGGHPVMIQVYDGHSVFANNLMLEKLAIPEMEGYIKDAEGKPTGLVEDPAVSIVFSAIIPAEVNEVLASLSAFAAAAFKEGVTSIHCKEAPDTIKIFEENRKRIPIRFRSLALFLPEYFDTLETFITSWDYGTGLTVGIIADGAPDSKTAGLFAPYPDNPNNYGTIVYTDSQMRSFIEKVHRAGHQVSIHACGNRTIEIILRNIEAVLKKYPKKDHRHRIEHYEIAFGHQIKRTAELGMVLAMQPQHINVSGKDNQPDYWMKTVGTENYRIYWPYRSILDEGIVIAGGSDSPVVPIRPLTGIHWAVNNIIHPSQSISVYEAIKIFTLGAAYAGFEEDLKGSIEPGKYADFAVLSDNPFSVPKEKIKEIQVEKTILGGNIVYSKEAGASGE